MVRGSINVCIVYLDCLCSLDYGGIFLEFVVCINGEEENIGYSHSSRFYICSWHFHKFVLYFTFIL